MNAITAKMHLIESVALDKDLVYATLNKLIVVIAGDYQCKLNEYMNILSKFEARYGMTTAQFQHEFDSGELGDATEWFDWDGYAALAEEARKKLAEIQHALS